MARVWRRGLCIEGGIPSSTFINSSIVLAIKVVAEGLFRGRVPSFVGGILKDIGATHQGYYHGFKGVFLYGYYLIYSFIDWILHCSMES